ncbi:hypothetical protein [Actinoplanes sp. NPDC051494]|uniref:hypothetical protein n=1 Tax=Actinoplanes sp. NPDC051494 TaxID=3363907 RepID=UPI00379F81C1
MSAVHRDGSLPESEDAGQSVPRTLAWMVAGGLALSGLMTGTATTTPVAEPQVRYIGDWTSTARTMGTGLVSRTKPRPAHDRDGEVPDQGSGVKWLHEASGLTWDQLGRLFGVSRRAVHLWASGGRMNAVNAETLGRLVALLRAIPGGPDERRAALLAPSAEGPSIVDQFRARHRSGARDISGTPFSPQELLGARHDDTAPM